MQRFAITDVAGDHFYLKCHAFLEIDADPNGDEVCVFDSEEGARDFCERRRLQDCHLVYRLIEPGSLRLIARWDRLADEVLAVIAESGRRPAQWQQRAERLGRTASGLTALRIRRKLRAELRPIYPGAEWGEIYRLVLAILRTPLSPIEARQRGASTDQLTAAAIIGAVRETTPSEGFPEQTFTSSTTESGYTVYDYDSGGIRWAGVADNGSDAKKSGAEK